MLNISNQKTQQLTDTGSNINHPSWHPQGKFIQFDQYFKTEKGGRSKIFQLNMASKQVTHLYSNEGSTIAAKIVGEQLYISNNQRGNWDVIKVDIKTGKETPVASGATDEMKASIFKAGNKIAYSVTNANGIAEVKVTSL